MPFLPETEKLEQFAKFIEDRWQSKLGLCLIEIVLFISIFQFTWANFDHSKSIFITITSCLFLLFLWWLSIKLPKTKKNKVGFLVAISCNDALEKKKIKEDFIDPLNKLIKSGKNGTGFDFLIASEYQSRKIISNDDAEKLRLKAKAHFMIYGNVKLRELNNVDTHIIELEGIVSHNKLDEKSTTEFSKEFAELLPRRLHASTKNDVLALQLTSQWTEIVAKYIIATASALSGDLDYSEKLYSEIKTKLPSIEDKVPVYNQLKQRIPAKLSEIKLIRAQRSFDEWINNKDDLSLIQKAEEYLVELIPEHQSLVAVKTLGALCCFLLTRDIKGSLANLNQISKSNRDVVWHLNMAFIHAYNLNLNNAARCYRLAAQEECPPHILSQVEDFMVWIIENEPENRHLFYALGYFNLKIKGDVEMANKDFQSFIDDKSFEKKYPNEYRIAKQNRTSGMH